LDDGNATRRVDASFRDVPTSAIESLIPPFFALLLPFDLEICVGGGSGGI